MALFLFTKSILQGKTIKVFNHGKMLRDFTYIDDIVESLIRIIYKPPTHDATFDTDKPNPATSWAPHRIFNIGNSNPTPLMDYISAIENCIGVKAKKEFLPLQMGDVPATSSDCSELESWIGFKPKTSINQGVEKFILWYKSFYGV
jgi:UDP-glucuronate 4-epimerase